MTDPRFAKATESGRFYYPPGYEDVTFRSVTNALGTLSKPALTGAAAKRAGERAVFQEQEWHAIQQEQGDEKARLWISSAMREYSDYAANMGSAVHFCAEHFFEHVEVVDGEAILDTWLIERVATWAEKMCKHRGTVDKNIEQVRKHVTQLARAIDTLGIEFIERERTVFSTEHGYAGTLDATVTIDGKTYLLDYKTGGVYPETSMQLAAYRFATHEVAGDVSRTRAMRADGGLVLQLKPASFTPHFVRCDEVVFERFLDVLRLAEWREQTVIGEEFRAR